jgi:hypothetical protein
MTAQIVSSDERDIRKVIFALNETTRGRSNATNTVTLTANTTTTTVTAVNCAEGSQVFLSPKTANAAGAVATTYISAIANGEFTITHANNAQVDKTFGYVCLG